MNLKLVSVTAAVLILGLTGCSSSATSLPSSSNPKRAILSTYDVSVTNENLLSQPRVSAYVAEVKSALPERYFTAPQAVGKNTDPLAIYYHPIKATLTGSGSLSGTDQYLGLLSDSGLDYPIDSLIPGTRLVVFLVADPAPRSDGLSESAPSWIGILGDDGTLRSLSPKDNVSISFESIRGSLGL